MDLVFGSLVVALIVLCVRGGALVILVFCGVSTILVVLWGFLLLVCFCYGLLASLFAVFCCLRVTPVGLLFRVGLV